MQIFFTPAWLKFAVLAVLSQLVSASAAGAGPAICWSPAALAGTPAERIPNRHPPGARIASPRLTIAAAEPVETSLRGSIRRVKLAGPEKLIALTFDVCEAGNEVAGYDGEIVDLLRREHVSATFFTGGKWLLTHKERAEQLMADPTFEIGSHNWSHGNMRRLSPEHASIEVSTAEAAYEIERSALAARQCMQDQPDAIDRVPAHMRLYRFPYGACNATSLRLVGDLGYLAIQWDVAMGDPSPSSSAAEMNGDVMRRVRPGSIILGHANGRGVHTAEALELLIPELRAKGYKFVTVSELLAHGTPETADRCYDRKPGDSDHYGEVAKAHLQAGVVHAGQNVVPPG